MTRIAESLLPLVLDEGQQARAEGVLVRLGDDLGILADDGLLHDPGASMFVAVDSDAPLAVEEGADIVATGRLRNRRLVVSSVAPRLHRRPTPLMATAQSAVDMGEPQLRPEAERSLMEDGALLSVEGRYAVATDAARVRATLAPIYGDELEVVENRWNATTFHDISALLDGDLTYATGNDFGSDHQLRVAATLLHLPTGLAEFLTPYAEALVLDTLLKPAS